MTIGEWLALWFTALLTVMVLTGVYIVLRAVHEAIKQQRKEEE